jgi:hypothetical protein
MSERELLSNYWGIPRTTHYLDFVIQLPPSAVPLLNSEDRHSSSSMNWQPGRDVAKHLECGASRRFLFRVVPRSP